MFKDFQLWQSVPKFKDSEDPPFFLNANYETYLNG